MDKLAPWPRMVARTLIAGLLAWALVMQGFAAAASARSGSVEVGVVSADMSLCAAEGKGGEHWHSPERHVPCSCCIPCRSGEFGDLIGIPAALPKSLELSFPAADLIRADLFLIGEPASPLGWTSSWSQRAPPRLS